MIKVSSLTLSTVAAFLSVQVGVIADEMPMCHDMPMRQSTLDLGQSILKDNGGPSSHDYRSSLMDSIPHSKLPLFPSMPLPVSDSPARHPVPIKHAFTPAQYMSRGLAMSILIAASEDEHNGRLGSANRLYKNLLFYNQVGEMDSSTRAIALEGAARTELLLHDATTPRPDSTANFTLRYTEIANFSTDLKAMQKAILHTTLSREDLKDAEWKYYEAWRLDGNPTTQFVLGLLKEKLDQTAEAADIFITLAQSSPQFADAIVPFLNRHPDLYVSKKAELAKVLPGSKLEFQIAYFQVNKIGRLSEHDKANFTSIYDQLVLASEPLSLTAIHNLMVNCPIDKRNKMVQYFRHTWRDSQVFAAQYADILTTMDKLGWQVAERALLTSFPQADSDDGFEKAIKLASFCADKHDQVLCLMQLHFALAAVKASYSDYARSSGEAKQLAALIRRYPTYKNATQTMFVEVNRLANSSTEQIRKRQCLEMAEKLNQTAFELEKKNLFAKAAELYQSALEIKQINLDRDDTEIAMQMIDVARARLGNKQFLAADKLYKGAIAVLKANRRANPRDLQTALESYGQALNTMHETTRAETVYKEARQLAKNS